MNSDTRQSVCRRSEERLCDVAFIDPPQGKVIEKILRGHRRAAGLLGTRRMGTLLRDGKSISGRWSAFPGIASVIRLPVIWRCST
jgi:hypothetical protein